MVLNLIFPIQLIFLVQSCFLFIVKEEKKDLESIFRENDMEIEPISVVPKKIIGVINNRNEEVKPGDHLPVSHIEHPLAVTWDTEHDYYYTVALIDYDAGCLLWLVVNICGNDVRSGTVLADYMKPQPKENEAHRCVLVVYRQTSKRTDFDFRVQRNGFDLENFADRHNFGIPDAASFFKASNDVTYNH